MPRAPNPKELESLTGIAREAARNYRHWKEGKLTADHYLVAVQGLRALTTTLQAVETERQREIDERLAAGIEALERQRQPSVPAIEHTPSAARPTPIVGELIPRESSDDEANS